MLYRQLFSNFSSWVLLCRVRTLRNPTALPSPEQPQLVGLPPTTAHGSFPTHLGAAVLSLSLPPAGASALLSGELGHPCFLLLTPVWRVPAPGSGRAGPCQSPSSALPAQPLPGCASVVPMWSTSFPAAP